MTVGIVGYGVYIPKYRIDRRIIGKAWSTGGRGENSVAYRDEDTLTMATEAALNAINHAAIDSTSELEAIYLGTDSPLHIEHSSLGIISEVLRAKEEIDLADFTASPRASFAALKACQDAVAAGRIKYGLVIGSEERSVSLGSVEELVCGDGAAALLLGFQNTLADFEGVYTYSTNIVDRWRETDSPYLKEYEPRFTRDYGYTRHIVNAKNGILKKLGADMGDFQHVILQQPDARMVAGAAKKMKIRPEQLELGDLFNSLGDLGAASVLMGLAAVLDKAKPGDRILALSYGSGVSDAIALKVNERIEEVRARVKTVESYLKSKVELEDYLTFAKMKGTLKKDVSPTKLGLPPASAALWRDGRDIRQLKGNKCKNCSYVNFPPSIRTICIRCGNTEFEKVILSRRGKVHTFCLSLYVPSPLQGPQPLIIADLDDGNRYRALGTEIRANAEIRIDMPVELVVRNIVTQDGIGIYGNVFRPLRDA
ncbi:MAG: hydroxymethylglutaryl-CoA synthase [Pseudomonadota bacterium]